MVELPEPLLTYNLYEAFTEAAVGGGDAGEGGGGGGAALGAFRGAAQGLPRENYLAARRVLRLLAAAAAGRSEAHQTSLALAFGPALLRPRPEGRFGGVTGGGGLVGLMEDLPAVVAATLCLIRDADAIFADPAAPDMGSEPAEPAPA
jgi:hypothetical protein